VARSAELVVDMNRNSAADGKRDSGPDDTVAAHEPRLVLHYTSTASDYLYAVMAASRASTIDTAAGCLFLLTGVGSVLLIGDLWSLAFVALGLTVLSGLFSAGFAWLTLRRTPDRGTASWETTITAGGMRERSNLIGFDIAWPIVRSMRETDRAFLLFAPGSTLFLPCRAFSSQDAATFRALLAAAGVQTARLSAVRKVLLGGTIAVLGLFVALAWLAGTLPT
jgi:hypothetical protein